MTRAAVLDLEIHGLRVAVGGSWEDVVDELRRDFSWFSTSGDGPADLRVEVHRRSPDYDRHAGLKSSFVTPRNVVYQGGGSTVVDYFGRALLTLDRNESTAVVEGDERVLCREAATNVLISRIGEHLDSIGLVRLHAVGLSGGQGAVAVVMPAGGGKSTLALQALSDHRCRILSEDSPLIDRHGVLHPFPLRIGLNSTDADLLPAGYPTRPLERLEFHPQLALDVEHFRDRVEHQPQPLRHLVLGRRTLARTGSLEPLARRHAHGTLLREAVVGVGVYQGMEFVLQHGWRDVLAKSGTATRRALVAASMLRRVRVWRLWLGRDRESNWAALRPLLGQH